LENTMTRDVVQVGSLLEKTGKTRKQTIQIKKKESRSKRDHHQHFTRLHR
jgi:ribosomal protein S30